MSYTITEADIRKFDANVKGEYQAASRLWNAFNQNSAAGASSYQVVRFGYGMGSRSVPGMDIPGMGSSTDKTIITLEDWDHAEYIDFNQSNQVNWDAVAKVATEVCGPAAGRRYDQIIIDALDTATVTEIDVDYGSTGTASGMVPAKIHRANSIMGSLGVPKQDRFMIASELLLEDMLSDSTMTSMDYVREQLNSAQEGKIAKFSGFSWIFLADNPEGGLSKTAVGTNDVYDCYACHRRALEVALGPRCIRGSDSAMTEIDKVPQKGSWIINAPLSMGAGVVETNGIVLVKAAVAPIA